MYYKLRFQEQLENILMPQTQKILNFSWRTMDGGSWHSTGGRDQDHGKEIQKGKLVVWGCLTNSCE